MPNEIKMGNTTKSSYQSIVISDELKTTEIHAIKRNQEQIRNGVFDVSVIESGYSSQNPYSSPSNEQDDLLTQCFRLLGFDCNPLVVNEGGRNSASADLRLAMLSNFSTAYNTVSISLALAILRNVRPVTKTSNQAFCSSALIGGMIVGQLLGGTIGDVVGRHRAMSLVMLLQIVAAIGSALSCSLLMCGREIDLYHTLTAWRFLLGIGCGGVYPLAATMTAESTHCSQNRAKLVALTFSMQGFGYLAVPLIAWLLVAVLGEGSNISWRVLLGLGCAPGIVLSIARSQRTHSLQKRPIRTNDFSSTARPRTAPVSIQDAVMKEPDLFRKLLGTSGCWFLFDVMFYGNTIFQPVVLSAAFGPAETVSKVAQDTLLINAMAFPGYLASIVLIGRQSPKFVQAQGFLLMGFIYTAIGSFFGELAGNHCLLLGGYGASFFFSNYGPNSTTYMLPSVTFSQACRSTLNGFCAACGKVGALLGALCFIPILHVFGEAWVMFACAAIAFTGFVLTLVFVNEETDSSESLKDTADHLCCSTFEDQQGMGNESIDLIVTHDRNLPLKVVFSRPSLFDYYDD
jgi:PHS family inorganic phosphate transporter-like MFS transporter